jgi:hypothetical protein
MVERSIPSTVSHACKVPDVSASGSPEENARRRMTPRLRSRKTAE